MRWPQWRWPPSPPVTAAAGIQDAHSTHVSVPVLTAGGDLEYLFADDLIIAGWVEYGGSPTPDVLLNIRVSDPDRAQVSETFVTSDSNGEFEYAFGLPEGSMPGDYSVTVTSMCWEQHRQICTHRTAQATVSVPEAGAGPGVHIPEWVKTVAGFWVDGQIDDDFVRAVGFLIRSGVIVIGDPGGTDPWRVRGRAGLDKDERRILGVRRRVRRRVCGRDRVARGQRHHTCRHLASGGAKKGPGGDVGRVFITMLCWD